MTWALIVVGVAVVVALGLMLWNRMPRRTRNDGVAGFRRHMDALSSDARRDVIDRVRDSHRDERKG